MSTLMFIIMNGAVILAMGIWRRYGYKTLSYQLGAKDKRWFAVWLLLIIWLNSK